MANVIVVQEYMASNATLASDSTTASHKRVAKNVTVTHSEQARILTSNATTSENVLANRISQAPNATNAPRTDTTTRVVVSNATSVTTSSRTVSII